ncbi:hypothetical protein JZ751_011629 [Albula glossodonta]|uniref:Uncharacterized protein n=1 Tax=Albula glossodonta TaxID=121402 RepID=A0A8T2N1W3_9TELE|nr:hypothetical protein JZ751_011629 [Albula glossodonta]
MSYLWIFLLAGLAIGAKAQDLDLADALDYGNEPTKAPPPKIPDDPKKPSGDPKDPPKDPAVPPKDPPKDPAVPPKDPPKDPAVGWISLMLSVQTRSPRNLRLTLRRAEELGAEPSETQI